MVRIVLIALGAFVAYRLLFKRSAPPGDPKLLTDYEGQPGGAQVTYEVVEHDGGWAYKVDDVFSETYATHEAATAAAARAAMLHRRAGADETVEYQDAEGDWHQETEPGSDRPETAVKDAPKARRGGAPAKQ